MSRLPFERVAIVGVGLIGGSLARALKRADSRVHILGIDSDPEALRLALRAGAIDAAGSQPGRGLEDCDLVVLATPVKSIPRLLEGVRPWLAPGALVTDVGSTKRLICTCAWELLAETNIFVGGHPMAGREVAGFSGSASDLFQGAVWVLCPPDGGRPGQVERVKQTIRMIGARPRIMSAPEHDRAVAMGSHLPQLISTALARAIEQAPESLSGSGLTDVLRLAGSPWSVWQGILETNADNIDSALVTFIGRLEGYRRKLHEGGLEQEFGQDPAPIHAARHSVSKEVIE